MTNQNTTLRGNRVHPKPVRVPLHTDHDGRRHPLSGSRALSLMPQLSSRGRYCLFWRPDERFLRQADRQVGPAASKAPRMRPPPWPYLSVAWLYRNRRGDRWPLVLTGIPLFERSQARTTRKTRPEAPRVSLQFSDVGDLGTTMTMCSQKRLT